VAAGKKSAASGGGGSGRKMLQELQPSAQKQSLLVGSDGVLRLGSSSERQAIKIYKDPKTPVTSTPENKQHASKSSGSSSKHVQATVKSTTAQTQVEESDTAQARAEQIMYGKEEDLPLEYWKDLAEKRREALEISLTENESLLTENESLQNSLSQREEDCARFEEEVEAYKSLAERAQELASILNGIEFDSDDVNDEDANDEVANDEKANDAE